MCICITKGASISDKNPTNLKIGEGKNRRSSGWDKFIVDKAEVIQREKQYEDDKARREPSQ